MPIEFTCPHCGATTKVADQYMGQTGPCSSCGKMITVPVMGAAGAVHTSSTVPIVLVIVLVAGIAFLGCGGLMVALLLPAVQAAREAARRAQCSNNLKQVALAMHNYHDTYRAFPPAYTVDENGNRLHSWRTLLLPFIEQQPLYEQIRLDEPWDSEHNKQIAETVLSAYCCPSEAGPSFYTNYVAIVGEGALFEGAEPTPMREITDGTSNTLLVVEIKESKIRWMEPADLDLAQMQMAINQGPKEIGSRHPGGAQAALADGSVRFISETIDRQTLKALMTRAGGEVIGDF